MVTFDRDLDCLVDGLTEHSIAAHAVAPAALTQFLAGLPPPQAAFLRQSGFAAKAGTVALLPGEAGLDGAVLGLGDSPGPGPALFGALPASLPPGTCWHLASGFTVPDAAVLGWCLGAYRYDDCRSARRPAAARLALAAGAAMPARRAARATWLVRDLVNCPANLLGPAELAQAAAAALSARGAQAEVVSGEAVERLYPTIAAVGRGSVRAPRVVTAHWQGSAAGAAAPLVSLCGKGVCFDTGGYDLKPSSGMLRMKKDMAGAAIALGVACMIIEADLPVRLALRLGCVENAVSGDAMRPMDVITTRRGLRVEVGNTDAEGRLVLCDLLAEASDEAPDLLADFATLTGAARVALGPELPAMFSNDDAAAAIVLEAAAREHDFVFRLPLWNSYDFWLDSNVADLNNVSDKPQAGAIVAALFLQRFIPASCRWLHFDVYGWNDRSRPGRPEGGEAQAMRAVFAGVRAMFGDGGRSSAEAAAQAVDGVS
jgi:leucyl aminopeptidase